MASLAANGGTPVRTKPYPRWPHFGDAERAAVIAVLDSGEWWSTGGTQVDQFETEWAAFTGADAAVTTTNGTHALEAALAALGIGQGDEVIVPDWSFMATIGAVIAVNAIPVIVDVDLMTGTLDPASLPAAVSGATRAVIPVHMAGSMADMDAIGRFATQHDLLILEDASHAHTSSWNGRHAGTLGDAGTFSFQASKLITPGEGGAVVSSRAEVMERARAQVNCGRAPQTWYYRHLEYGSNFRMTEWQGAVLRAQLGRLPAQQAIRSANADALNTSLAEIPGLQPQGRLASCTSQGNYCYVVRVDTSAFGGVSRDQLRTALLAEGLPVTTGYPPMHRLEMFADPDGLAPRIRDRAPYPNYAAQQFPVTDKLADTTIWLKTSALMGSESDTRDVIDAFAKAHEHAEELHGLPETQY
jgi:3-amino-5-hydroxybenzoate synthase